MKNKKWIWSDIHGKLIPEKHYEKQDHHFVQEDTKDYLSPTSFDEGRGHMKLVSGRAQRREDLKANDCREVDPGEKNSMMKWKNKNETLPEILQGDNFERSHYQAEQRKRLGLR
tara:strand:- start:132 stop:473 length:342 start_codon:yes stop_codon:yes gene_type:complete